MEILGPFIREKIGRGINKTRTPRLGADHLTLGGGGGVVDFEKKNSCKRLLEEKNCMQHKCTTHSG